MIGDLSNRFATTFALLILAQAAHSIEEYIGRLWESFPPARVVAGLVSDDLRFGFLLVNMALVTFGVWCYLWPVSRGWRAARAIALGWALVELINGAGHPLWSIRQGGYTPGVATALLLFALAVALLAQLRQRRVTPAS